MFNRPARHGGAVNAQTPSIDASPWFAPALTAVYASLLLFTMLHHEMWRDELQAWLIARDSTGVLDLFRNLKYEGHPALWHLLLMPVTRLTANPVGMQIVHFLIASTTVFLVAKYAPFNPLQKVLFSFGYFPLYKYGALSRNYALGLLLVIALCLLLQQRWQKPLRVALVLFLLSHTSVHACIIAIGATIGLMLDYYLLSRCSPTQHKAASVQTVYAAFSIMVVGIVTAALQMNPPADSLFSSWHWKFELPRFESIVLEFVHRITPFLGARQLQGHGTLIAVVLFAAIAVYHRRRPAAVAMFSFSTLGLTAFFYTKYPGGYHHWGFYLVAFLLLVWGGRYLTAFPRNSGRRMTTVASTFASYLMTGFLLFQTVGGIRAVIRDVQHPFSSAQQTAEYIREQNLDSLPMIGVADYAASTVAGYLGPDRKIDYVHKNRGKSYIVWHNGWSRNLVSDAAAIAHAEKIASQTRNKVLLIFNRQLSLKPDVHHVEPIAAFTKARFIRDENFYLYLYESPVDSPPR